MKKVFNFGKIDYTGNGRADNAVKVTVEYKTENEKKVFTASGEIWQANYRDILAGGQCLDTIAEYIKDPIFLEILRLWHLYHLNDMHPECEHQAALGWREKASEKVTLYTFTMKSETISEQHKLERAILTAAREGKTYQTTKEEQALLNLQYSVKTHCDTLPENIAEYYKLKESESKALGWLNESEHPDGILSRACPVCGYKYGTKWLYRPIPAEDEQKILDLFK